MAGKGAVHQGTQVDFHKGMLVRGACRGQVGGPQTRCSLRPRTEICKNGFQRRESINPKSLLPAWPIVPRYSRPGLVAEGLVQASNRQSERLTNSQIEGPIPSFRTVATMYCLTRRCRSVSYPPRGGDDDELGQFAGHPVEGLSRPSGRRRGSRIATPFPERQMPGTENHWSAWGSKCSGSGC